MNNRICIYAKDVQVITGKSERSARKLLSRIRQHYAKDKHHFITVSDFCEYTGVGEEEVRKVMRG